jgi:hypothetical protein
MRMRKTVICFLFFVVALIAAPLAQTLPGGPTFQVMTDSSSKGPVYRLTWEARLLVPVPCASEKPDPYTGEMPMSVPAVFCVESHTRCMSREFYTLEEARLFYENRPTAVQANLENWKLVNIRTGKEVMLHGVVHKE